MQPKVVLITGANSGIGRAAVHCLYASGDPQTPYHILASGRSLAKVQRACDEIRALVPGPAHASSTIEALHLDIASDASVAAAAEHVSRTCAGRLDALVNNAGGSFDADCAAGTMTEREAWSRTMDLAAVAPQVVTAAFAGLLVAAACTDAAAPSRLLFLTSGMSSLQEEHDRATPGEARQPVYARGWPKPQRQRPGNAYAYRVGKAALNMVFLQWSRILEPDGVRCFALSPGFLATNLGGDAETMRRAGAGDPMLGGGLVVDVLEGRRDADAGRIVKRDGGVQTW